MSISIYSGVRINVNIFTLNSIVTDLRKEVTEKTNELKSAWFSDQCSQTLDLKVARGMAYDFEEAFQAARNKWEEDQADIKKGHRHPSCDFEFKLAVYPYKGRLYGRYFCEQAELIALLMNKPEIEEFHYQNSTDKPDNITGAKWRARENIWGGIFSDDKNYGFVADLADRYADRLFDLSREKIRTELPEMSKRLDYVAKVLAAEAAPEGQFMDSREKFSFSKYMEYMHSDEFKAKYNEEVTRLATILPSAY